MTESQPLRLMAVHAHPDDESSKGAATMCRYVAEGVQVLVVTCTGGERGSVLNPHVAPIAEEDMPAVRRAEMAKAREVLGVDQVWLGFVDSGFPEGDPLPPLPEGCFGLVDPQVAAEPLVKLMREFRPHVVITYDEEGGYPHPDHVMCHRLSVAAFEASGDPDRFPEAGEPWQPLKLYYHMGWSKERLVTLNDAMIAAGLPAPYAERLEQWTEKDDERDKGRRITTRVPCGDFFPQREEALRAHASQVNPDVWFTVPTHIQREAWPTEEYELARSLVDTTTPENDLFAGIRTVPDLPRPTRDGEVAWSV